jgi:hypothetical protein
LVLGCFLRIISEVLLDRAYFLVEGGEAEVLRVAEALVVTEEEVVADVLLIDEVFRAIKLLRCEG